MEAALADGIVVVHLAFASFMVVGILGVPIGGLLGWSWVRNWTFRRLHLAGMGIVALQAVLRVPCFLTIWEFDLRRAADQQADPRSFIGRLAHDWLYVDVPNEVLWGLYVVLFCLLLGCEVWVKPRPRGAGRT